MGNRATISFGIVIAHQSVPLAIALENLWSAEAGAKDHRSEHPDSDKVEKNAVQVRIMYQNGNILPSTAKFEVFKTWQNLIDTSKNLDLDAALFEQAATIWLQHPAPENAIEPWCQAFCIRRDAFTNDDNKRSQFQTSLDRFITTLTENTIAKEIDREIGNWLKLAAFIIRRREIKIIDN